jgi:hypothetical protein
MKIGAACGTDPGVANRKLMSEVTFWSLSSFRKLTSLWQQPSASAVSMPHLPQISCSIANNEVESNRFMQ